jgi:hypothetical protein
MNAHTPGPWDRRIEYNLLKDEIGVHGKAICSVWVRRFDGTLSDERRIVRDPEGEANARLIKAAPSLLEALCALGVIGDGYCFCSSDRDPEKAEHQGECREARAAIALATGAST